MFWKFDLHSSSHIDTLLEREDVTLKELMDEEDVLQECKAQNRKLIEFLLKAECLEDLVSFIIGVCEDLKCVSSAWEMRAGPLISGQAWLLPASLSCMPALNGSLH